MVSLRIIYSLMLANAIFHLFRVLPLLYSTAENIAIKYSYLHIQEFEKTWSLGLIVFGLHLVLLGVLTWKSKTIPKIWGILLVIAGFSYTAINILNNFYPQFKGTTEVIESILMLPMIVGEIGFATWLIFKGGKTKF